MPDSRLCNDMYIQRGRKRIQLYNNLSSIQMILKSPHRYIQNLFMMIGSTED